MKTCYFLLLLALVAGPAWAQFGTYGMALAVGEGEVFVGSPLSTAEPGAVHVYRKADDGAWEKTATLVGEDATFGDIFGSALALDGDRLLVGALAQSPFPEGPEPAAYLFERDADGAWQRVATLKPSTPAPFFGGAAALHGDVALVGAMAADGAAGAVFVFRRQADGSWMEEAKLTSEDAAPGARFGMQLTYDGTRALIGAPVHSGGAGAAYVYRHDEAGWQHEATLLPDSTSGGLFGMALYLDADHALIAAPHAHDRRGAIHIYQRHGTHWMAHGSLTAPDDESHSLGRSLAADGESLWAGAPGTAAAFVFTQDDAGNASSIPVHNSEPQPGDGFGGTVAVRGDVALVTASASDNSFGRVVVFERDAEGAWHATAALGPTAEPLAAITGEQTSCEDGAAAGFACDRVDLVAFLPVAEVGGGRGVIVNDLWGWTDPETGVEYAVIGRNDGTAFLDLRDPVNPVFLGTLPRTEGAPGRMWRDVKVYKDHAFIVADNSGAHGVQIFDLRQLRDVENPPVMFEETARYDGFHSAHNLVINEETGFAYAVGTGMGGETCGGALHMINIQDPANPSFAGCYADPSTGNSGTGYTHDAQCVVYRGPDTEHQGKEICFNASENALGIGDVTDKENPTPIAHASYPNVAYAHQGWLTEDHRFFFLNDEGDEVSGVVDGTRTLIWDVTDLDDPQLAGTLVADSRAADHNLYVKGNLMYQANYVDGLRIYDVADPANPTEVGRFDTRPHGDDSPLFDGAWSVYPYFESGVLVVTSMQEGVFILRRQTIDI